MNFIYSSPGVLKVGSIIIPQFTDKATKGLSQIHQVYLRLSGSPQPGPLTSVALILVRVFIA